MKKLGLLILICACFSGGYAQNDVVAQDTLNRWLTYNIPGQTVVDSLGAPNAKGEFEYYESDGGFHQQWEYTSLGLTLWVVSDTIGSASTVESIFLTDNPSFVTTKGIHIGSPKEQVLDLYGVQKGKTPFGIIYRDPDLLIIGTIYEGIFIQFSDDKVSMISTGVGYAE